ncbi:unnamed protein product [Sphagnum balticum]
MRYLWIRIALFEKLLVDIVDHLVQNSSKYYEKDALVADQVFGQILSSLLVGPCALDYSKMKTQDHFWTDPPADELVQRHRLSGTVSNGPSTPPSGKKPLGYQKRAMDISKASTNSTDDNQCNGSPPVGRNPNLIWSPRDYVQSLHQNSRSTLLYGKNNVVIQPGSIRKTVWPYLLGHYEFSMTNEEKVNRDEDVRQQYEMTMSEWLAVEAIVRQRDKEIMQANLAKLSSESTKSTTEIPLDGPKDHNMSNEVFETSSSESESDNDNDETKSNTANGINSTKKTRSKKNKKESSSSSRPTSAARRQLRRHRQVESQGSSPIFVTNPSVDVNAGEKIANQKDISDINKDTKEVLEPSLMTIADGEGEGHLAADTGSQCVSPASSNGGIYSNLEKLRNVMCTYVWEHLDIGYVQGMCDLVAPLLVIYDDGQLKN